MNSTSILNRINQFDQSYGIINNRLNCFTYNLSQYARECHSKNSGTSKILLGKLIAIKDNINIEGYPTTCCSNILQNNISSYNATVIDRIIKAGGSIVAKTNMDEFAMGSSSEQSIFGAVKNPHNELKVAGGSSGGSAAAVSSGEIDIALGSDTGGSVRQPASFCGNFGFKPTYGRISRYGLTAFASSLDQIGIFANNTLDISHMYDSIGGYDSHDSNTSKQGLNNNFKKIKAKSLRIGYIKDLFDHLDPQSREIYNNFFKFLKSSGFPLQLVKFKLLDLCIPTYYIIATAEASSNLARFDGVKYGKRNIDSNNVNQMIELTRSKNFGEEIKRRIMLGTYVLSSGYFEAYYNKALKVRRLIKDDLIQQFNKIDLLLFPTSPSVAFDQKEKLNNILEMYLSDIFTIPMSLAGIPSINIPIGQVTDLPIGIQACSNYFEESKIFSFTQYIEDHYIKHN